MNDSEKVRFLPFHSINEFMLDDYRRKIIQTVLSRSQDLPSARRAAVANLIKKYVTVHGFRNSAQAPLGLKVKGSVSTFMKTPEFTAQILQGWSELNPELREQVYSLLKERDWEVMPAEADRTKLPGFFVQWPENETYDSLDQAYAEKYPEAATDENDLRLMVVWIGCRLPYNMDIET